MAVAEPLTFTPWPKIHRLFRDVVVTEKINGTNAAIGVTEDYEVYAQSRKKLIFPGKQTDNYGFAGWVQENRGDIIELLGPGLHFGEWFGEGIQGNPNQMSGKWFALFNAPRWRIAPLPERVITVPILYEGPFSEAKVLECVADVRDNGSKLGGKAEGVVVYFTVNNMSFKIMCENDDIPKGLVT
jgi:hypothetical protein